MSDIKIAKFISGDGVEHTVEVGTPAFAHMVKEGFQRLDAPAKKTRMLGAGESADETPEVDLSTLKRDELIEKAAELGIEIDAADKTQTKKVIIAAIEAKLAETADEDETEETDES